MTAPTPATIAYLLLPGESGTGQAVSAFPTIADATAYLTGLGLLPEPNRPLHFRRALVNGEIKPLADAALAEFYARADAWLTGTTATTPILDGIGYTQDYPPTTSACHEIRVLELPFGALLPT